jgi:hypothetical protein
MRGSLFKITTFVDPTATQAEKAELPLQLEKDNNVDLPPLISVEATGVCIAIEKSQGLHAAVYKSPGRACSDSDITELLSFRRKSILAGI